MVSGPPASEQPVAGQPPRYASPTSQSLHDRAAASARETRGHVLAMATGSLAVFFLALTARTDPPLSAPQKSVVLGAIVAMAIAIFAGLWSAYSDAQWSYCWAKDIEGSARPDGGDVPWQAQTDRWHRQKRGSERVSLLAFITGVLFAAIYLVLRV